MVRVRIGGKTGNFISKLSHCFLVECELVHAGFHISLVVN